MCFRWCGPDKLESGGLKRKETKRNWMNTMWRRIVSCLGILLIAGSCCLPAAHAQGRDPGGVGVHPRGRAGGRRVVGGAGGRDEDGEHEGQGGHGGGDDGGGPVAEPA